MVALTGLLIIQVDVLGLVTFKTSRVSSANLIKCHVKTLLLLSTLPEVTFYCLL